MQRTHADWRDVTNYLVHFNKHFKCLEEGTVTATQFGIQKRHLRSDAVPTISNRPTTTTISQDRLQEGPSVDHIEKLQ